MPPTIPMGDLRREYGRIRPEIDDAIERVLRRGWFVLGEEVEAFEAEWAAYCGTAHAVGVGNSTTAVHLALRAAGVGAGDEVVIPALAAASTAVGVVMAGATPVFADVDPVYCTLDAAALAAAITPRTAVVVPVHLYGCPANMEAILQVAQRHGLLVVEDAGQAHGARYRGTRTGALGDVATFGFYPTKNLGAYGNAGAVCTGDANLAAKARLLRLGGQQATDYRELLGINSRLDEVQAAILRAKLPHLGAWNRRRRNLAARYDAGLSETGDLTRPAVPPESEHVYHQYVVRTSLRDALREYLAGAGVATSIHYACGQHLQPAFADLGYAPGSCPNAEELTAEVLSLPLFPQLTAAEAEQVIRLIRVFFAMH